jgi:hypothetical protein
MRTLTDTIPYQQPGYDHDAGTIALGPGVEPGRTAAWRLYRPGAMLSGVITRGLGMGASRLLDLIGHSAMCSGNTVVWYADLQAGVSSPGLARAADRSALSINAIRAMFAAAARIAEARAEQQRRNGENFTPRPDRPGVLILVEELWALACDQQIRADLERVVDKYHSYEAFARSGVAFAATAHDLSLSSFGKSSAVRNIMTHNVVAFHQRAQSARDLVPSLLDRIPQIPGYGCHLYPDGNDTTVFRAAYLGDATEADRRWFTTVPAAARARLDAAATAAAAHTGP